MSVRLNQSTRVECLSPRFILPKSEFIIDNLLVRIHFIIEMIWWTGLAPWEFDFHFPDSLASTVLDSTCKSHTNNGLM